MAIDFCSAAKYRDMPKATLHALLDMKRLPQLERTGSNEYGTQDS
jgi:hypothetical protein